MKGLIGILGGMGPLATVDLLRKIIEQTPVQRDQDHVPVVVWSVPQVPDRQQALRGDGASPLPAMLEGIAALNRAGVTRIAIACNTAHYWFDQLRAASAAPIFHIADVTLDALYALDPPRAPHLRDAVNATNESGAPNALNPSNSSNPSSASNASNASNSPNQSNRFKDVAASRKLEAAPVGPIGLLGTRGTVLSGIYQSRLTAAGLECIVNTDEEITRFFEPGCHAVKCGDLQAGGRLLEQAAEALFARGATRVILGCTEVPVGLAAIHSPLLAQCIDPTLALARACVKDWQRAKLALS
ncbi:MAG: aspartate racemase [Herminiimonas sp.]|nr:aspartate racemase [Herminiimonas sp.]MDB5854518.1 aspartate racemase [Herminiimonas sp.]